MSRARLLLVGRVLEVGARDRHAVGPHRGGRDVVGDRLDRRRLELRRAGEHRARNLRRARRSSSPTRHACGCVSELRHPDAPLRTGARAEPVDAVGLLARRRPRSCRRRAPDRCSATRPTSPFVAALPELPELPHAASVNDSAVMSASAQYERRTIRITRQSCGGTEGGIRPVRGASDSSIVVNAKISDTTTVSRSRLRSTTVDPAPDPPATPPNMSESPPPRPECSRMNTIRIKRDGDLHHDQNRVHQHGVLLGDEWPGSGRL